MYRSKDLLSVLNLFVLDQWEKKTGVCVSCTPGKIPLTVDESFGIIESRFGGWDPVQCYLEPGATVLIHIPRSVSPFKILKGQTVYEPENAPT